MKTESSWSWCQLCRHWWHRMLSLWQPPVPPMTTNLASWQRSVFKCIYQKTITLIPYKALALFATRLADVLGASESLSCSHIPFNLIWNGLHGKYVIQTHLGEIYEHVSYVCAIWDTQAFSLKNHCSFNTKSYCSDVCRYHRRPQTLAETWKNMCTCCGFKAVASRRKYPGFML